MSLRIIALLFFCGLSAVVSFAQPPQSSPYFEALQRGYRIQGDSVVFPDSSACLLQAFNAGHCGQQWMTPNYCTPQGALARSPRSCCKGLTAVEDEQGRLYCVPGTVFPWGTVKLMGGLIALLLLLYLALHLRTRKKIRERKSAGWGR